jgi:hypothetical protein
MDGALHIGRDKPVVSSAGGQASVYHRRLIPT